MKPLFITILFYLRQCILIISWKCTCSTDTWEFVSSSSFAGELCSRNLISCNEYVWQKVVRLLPHEKENSSQVWSVVATEMKILKKPSAINSLRVIYFSSKSNRHFHAWPKHRRGQWRWSQSQSVSPSPLKATSQFRNTFVRIPQKKLKS